MTLHTIEAVIFCDLAVAPEGTFTSGQSGTRIQGGSYAAGHATGSDLRSVVYGDKN